MCIHTETLWEGKEDGERERQKDREIERLELRSCFLLVTGSRLTNFMFLCYVSVQLHTSAFISSHSCAWLGPSVLCTLNPKFRT